MNDDIVEIPPPAHNKALWKPKVSAKKFAKKFKSENAKHTNLDSDDDLDLPIADTFKSAPQAKPFTTPQTKTKTDKKQKGHASVHEEKQKSIQSKIINHTNNNNNNNNQEMAATPTHQKSRQTTSHTSVSKKNKKSAQQMQKPQLQAQPQLSFHQLAAQQKQPQQTTQKRQATTPEPIGEDSFSEGEEDSDNSYGDDDEEYSDKAQEASSNSSVTANASSAAPLQPKQTAEPTRLRPNNNFLGRLVSSTNTYNSRIAQNPFKSSTKSNERHEPQAEQTVQPQEKLHPREEKAGQTSSSPALAIQAPTILASIASKNSENMVSLLNYYQQLEGIALIEAIAKRYSLSVTIHDRPEPPANFDLGLDELVSQLSSPLAVVAEKSDPPPPHKKQVTHPANPTTTAKTTKKATDTQKKPPNSFAKQKQMPAASTGKKTFNRGSSPKRPQTTFVTGSIGYKPRSK